MTGAMLHLFRDWRGEIEAALVVAREDLTAALAAQAVATEATSAARLERASLAAAMGRLRQEAVASALLSRVRAHDAAFDQPDAALTRARHVVANARATIADCELALVQIDVLAPRPVPVIEPVEVAA